MVRLLLLILITVYYSSLLLAGDCRDFRRDMLLSLEELDQSDIEQTKRIIINIDDSRTIIPPAPKIAYNNFNEFVSQLENLLETLLHQTFLSTAVGLKPISSIDSDYPLFIRDVLDHAQTEKLLTNSLIDYFVDDKFISFRVYNLLAIELKLKDKKVIKLLNESQLGDITTVQQVISFYKKSISYDFHKKNQKLCHIFQGIFYGYPLQTINHFLELKGEDRLNGMFSTDKGFSLGIFVYNGDNSILDPYQEYTSKIINLYKKHRATDLEKNASLPIQQRTNSNIAFLNNCGNSQYWQQIRNSLENSL